MRENWKDFHRKRGFPANRSRTRGHNVCHAASKPLMQNRAPSVTKRRRRRRRRRRGRDIYIYMCVCVCVCMCVCVCVCVKHLVTPKPSMCIRAKINKPSHIPATVWGMDDPRNRGVANGPNRTTYIVHNHDQGRIIPSCSSSQWWSSAQDKQCHPRPSSGHYKTFTPFPAVERTTHH